MGVVARAGQPGDADGGYPQRPQYRDDRGRQRDPAGHHEAAVLAHSVFLTFGAVLLRNNVSALTFDVKEVGMAAV